MRLKSHDLYLEPLKYQICDKKNAQASKTLRHSIFLKHQIQI
ncbi:MAG: hypothetical protein ACJA1A_002957 [Saprospiraceae bacterium]|jgi:hypothetical protein